MGRPHHEIAAVKSVARRAGINLTARSSVREPHFHPVAQTETARSARGTRTAEPPHRPVSRTVKQPQLHGSPGRRNQPRRSGCPKHRCSLRRTGRSSVPELVLAAGCPDDDRGPSALIRSEADPFARLPARRFRPHARMPMLEALASRSFPREAFPRQTVTCVASGSRCD